MNKKIKNFPEFLNEAEILESGLVAGKVDLSEIVEVCDFLHKEYLKGVSEKFPGMQERLMHRTTYYMSVDTGDHNPRVFNNTWDSSLRAPGVTILYNGDKMNVASYASGVLTLTDKYFEKNLVAQETVLAHEFSHAIDPVLHKEVSSLKDREQRDLQEEDEMRIRKVLGLRDKDDYDKWMNNAYEEAEAGNVSLIYKRYLRQTTEIEAHTGMLVYILNMLLTQNPEKREAVKAILRKGDWKINSVFPELDDIVEHVRDRVDNYGKIKTKLLKRMAALVSQEELPVGKKPAYLVIFFSMFKRDYDYIFKNEYQDQAREFKDFILSLREKFVQKFPRARVE
jgi:hypothetical protein